jgi:PAS domain S-box-containing protein
MSDMSSPATNNIRSGARAGWDERNSQGHSVQFYEDDNFLLDGLSRFIGAALLAGDATVVVATKPHRVGLNKRLASRGLNLQPAIAEGRFISLDAAETLSTFMVNGLPDEARFSRLVTGMLTQLEAAARGEHPRVAAFGEMVALLWAEGKSDAAIRLEQLWNKLARTHSFQLHCAYPIHLFSRERDADLIKAICLQHTLTVPTEEFTALISDEERRRTIVSLQQRARSLETEIRERKKVDVALRASEERLRLSQQVARIGSFEWNFETTVYRCTPEWESMYGLAPGRFDGTLEAWEELLHPDDRVETMELARSAVDTGAITQGEWRVVWPDGTIRWIAGWWQVLKNEAGMPLRVTGVNIDITERKLAEEASLQLAAIVQSVDDAIVGKDLNGLVTSWNPAAETIFGYRAEEIVGRSILTIVPPELYTQEPMILAKLRAGERIENYETVRLRKDGERINVALTMSPVRNQAGRIIGIAKIARDITRQKKLEDSLHMSEKLAAVGRLAATIAHEINNPLEAVTNFIYLANHEPGLPDRIRNYLKGADRELRRVSHIAQQTLGFYRDDSQPAEIAIAESIETILTIYEHRFRQKALRIEKRIQPRLVFFSTEGEFKQILSNLIANAIDASNEGGRILICARAMRHLQSGREGIRVTIADEGIGISPEHKPQLFAPFFTTKKEFGTGLGLWVTKDLIEKKDGRIRFRSQIQPKSGTAMSFFIPNHLPAL